MMLTIEIETASTVVGIKTETNEARNMPVW
jgi:hypothetical protein